MRLSVALDMSCFRYAECLLYIWDRRGRGRMVVLMPLVVSLSVTCVRSVVSSTNRTERHYIAEILLKVALNTTTLTLLCIVCRCFFYTASFKSIKIIVSCHGYKTYYTSL